MSTKKPISDQPMKPDSGSDWYFGNDPVMRAMLEERAAEAAERGERVATRAARAAKVRKVAEHFGISIRQAQMLYRDKARDPERARELVRLFPDTTFKDWYDAPKDPGRPVYVPDYLDAPNIPLVSFRRFINRGELAFMPRRGSAARKAFERCQRLYYEGKLQRAHFASVGELVDATGFTEGMAKLWTYYHAWRIEHLPEADTRDLLRT
jgi:hypothetical protein